MAKNHRIGYLEGLRGITSFIVVVHHFVYGFYPALLTGNPQQVHTQSGWEVAFGHTPLNILYNGHFYVSILFVLSAYVLSYRFFQTGNEQVIVASAIKRYFRLEVPILASVVFAGGLMYAHAYYNQEAAQFSYSDWLQSFWNFAPSIDGMLYQSFWSVFFHNHSTYNAVLWTMQYELYGSFLVFAFCLLAGKLRNRWLIYGVLLCWYYDTLYLSFILGLMLSDWDARRDNRAAREMGGMLLFLGALFLGSYLENGSPLYRWMSGYGKYQFDFMLFYQNVGAGMLVWAMLLSVRVQNFLAVRVFQYFGWISFSLYLTHLPIQGTLASYLFYKACLMGWSYKVAVAVAVVPSVAVMIAVAHIMTLYVDQPALQIAEAIRRRFFAPEALSADGHCKKNSSEQIVSEQKDKASVGAEKEVLPGVPACEGLQSKQ